MCRVCSVHVRVCACVYVWHMRSAGAAPLLGVRSVCAKHVRLMFEACSVHSIVSVFHAVGCLLSPIFSTLATLREVLKEPIGSKDRPWGPPTANRQPPTTNRRQPPTANRHQPPTTNRHQSPPIPTANRQPPIATNHGRTYELRAVFLQN